MQSIWCESRPHSGLWEDSSFPIHSQQQWDKTKIDKAEAAAGARVLWLTSSEQSNSPCQQVYPAISHWTGKGRTAIEEQRELTALYLEAVQLCSWCKG